MGRKDIRAYLAYVWEVVAYRRFWSLVNVIWWHQLLKNIQDLGAEDEHIPGDRTRLCQPHDVGINILFQSRIYGL